MADPERVRERLLRSRSPEVEPNLLIVLPDDSIVVNKLRLKLAEYQQRFVDMLTTPPISFSEKKPSSYFDLWVKLGATQKLLEDGSVNTFDLETELFPTGFPSSDAEKGFRNACEVLNAYCSRVMEIELRQK